MPQRSPQDETHDLFETLVFTYGVILDSDAANRSRSSAAYASAQVLAAAIPLDQRSRALDLSVAGEAISEL